MTTLFLSHTPNDTACAETLRQALETQGYNCWRAPGYVTPTMYTYPRIVESGIVGSAALVLIWNAAAAHDEWVIRHLLFAQRLRKAMIPVLLDQTALPNTLIVPATVTGSVASYDTIAQLLALLPALQSADPLFACAEKAAQESISDRKTAIDLAGNLLARHEHREEALALLEYLARHDLMSGVREKAQEALAADTQQQQGPQAAPPLLRPEDSRHIFPVTCEQCGQISYFDKRRVCAAHGPVLRQARRIAEKELDTLELPCAHCPHRMLVLVDCEGY
jgi:ribosomal protein L37E